MISDRELRSPEFELPRGGSLERELPRTSENPRKRIFQSVEVGIPRSRKDPVQKNSLGFVCLKSTNPSDRPAPCHQKKNPKEETDYCPVIPEKMAFEVLQDFHDKVHQILRFSDPQVVISGLVSLADGDKATVPGGIIEPLSGLGEKNLMPSDNKPYRIAMRELLEWGLRHFPIQPDSSGVRLWSTMAIFDGDRGYNQW